MRGKGMSMTARFKYLIVGGGMTADSAAKGIRSVDGDGAIGMITDEPDPPYDRPPLSKGLWKGKPIEKIWRKTEERGVTLVRERRAVSIDAERRIVVDHQGGVYGYERLLLATGGTPKRPFAGDSSPLYYRTLGDYRALRALADGKQRFIVAGGGFIGSEIAAALAMNGKDVVMAFFESGICGGVLPPELTERLNRYYEGKGVRVVHGKGVTRMARTATGVEVVLEDGSRLDGDAVVAGLGVAPNVELAAKAGLDVGNGIVVDEFLRTSRANIFAAGDVANFPCLALGRRVRVEHEDNANTMGILAGRNMAGENAPYRHLPFFYSDLFDIGYEAVGETDPSHRTLMVWLEPNAKGALFYLRGDTVRGILFWNMFGNVDAGREIITTARPCGDADLKSWARERLAL